MYGALCGHVKSIWNIYLLTAIGLTPGGSSTVHIYTQYTEQEYIYIYIYIYLLTAIGLTPGGSSTVHIYTKYTEQEYIYTFVNCNWVDTRWQQYSTHLHTNNTQNNTTKQNTQNRTYITIRVHKYYNKNT